MEILDCFPAKTTSLAFYKMCFERNPSARGTKEMNPGPVPSLTALGQHRGSSCSSWIQLHPRMPQASAGESFVLQKEGKPGRGVGGDFGMVQLEGGIPSPLWELQFLPQLKTPSFPQNHSRIPKNRWNWAGHSVWSWRKTLEKLPGWCPMLDQLLIPQGGEIGGNVDGKGMADKKLKLWQFYCSNLGWISCFVINPGDVIPSQAPRAAPR